MDIKTVLAKKVAGIPVLYLAGGAAVLGLTYAIKMKSTVTSDTGGTGDEGTEEEKGGSLTTSGSADYSGLDGTGTVIVQPQQPAAEEKVEETNETWGKAAIDYLIDSNAASPGAAQAAITTYLSGGDLTYEQGLLRDAAIRKLKTPPQSITVGTTGAQPAQKQFSLFPGTHTVKGSNDNTAGKLAALYYGVNDGLHQDLIVENNVQYGPRNTTYNVGTKLKIPAWVSPVYYTTNKTTRTLSAIAAKNGLTVSQIQALNPSRDMGQLPLNLRIRIR